MGADFHDVQSRSASDLFDVRVNQVYVFSLQRNKIDLAPDPVPVLVWRAIWIDSILCTNFKGLDQLISNEAAGCHHVTIDDLPNTLGSASYTSAKRAAGYTQDDVSFIKRHYICDCLELLRDLEQH